jgi:CheY-like chemotaxis protein
VTEDTRGPAPRKSLSVIVIDDEPDVLAYLSAVLEQAGHRPLVADNANDGFALLKSERPDVACIDIVMPEETGVTLYRRIRGDPQVAHTPIIFITALTPELAVAGWSAGDEEIPEPDGYIEKPPHAATFLETVIAVAKTAGGR